MSNLIRGTVPGTRIVSRISCLILISICVNLAALPLQSVAQLIPSLVISPTSRESKIPRQDRTQADHSRSIKLYRTHCIDCHETDGRGGSSRELMQTIPDFTRPEWHSAHDDDRLQHSIREGKGFMPAMKDKLRPTEVVHLVSLVRNFRGGEQVVPDEPADQQEPATQPEARTSTESARILAPSDAIPGLFQRLCSSCHGADGHGNGMRAQLPWLPDFTVLDWHQRRNDAQLTASVLEGKGTAMPAFNGKLGEPQVRELVAYLRSFVPAGARSIPTNPSSDFRRRYQELQDQMNKLKRQYRALSRP